MRPAGGGKPPRMPPTAAHRLSTPYECVMGPTEDLRVPSVVPDHKEALVPVLP
jgi:hypothetical protein